MRGKAASANRRSPSQGSDANDESEPDPAKRELGLLRLKVNSVREAIEEELKNPGRATAKPKSYIELASLQIEKLLAAARKKKKERARSSQLGTLESRGSSQRAQSRGPKDGEPD